jgi:predicted dehydrogenase
VSIEEANLEQGDALKSEIESFLDCIRNNKRPIVSGEDGLRALETAIRITEQVHANLVRSAADIAAGLKVRRRTYICRMNTPSAVD